MIPNEIERLIYRSIMGDNVVVIASEDETASKRFKELRDAVVIAADGLKRSWEKIEREIIEGQPTDMEPIGIFADYEGDVDE